MKIIFLACLTKEVAGGAEKTIINLANWMADNYPENEIILASVEGDKIPYAISNNVKFYKSIKCKNKLLTHLSIMFNTFKVMLVMKPDVVVGFWIHPVFYALVFKLLRDVSIIYSVRNDPAAGYGIVAKIMRYFVTKYSDGCVFQTTEAMNFFKNDVRKKSRVIFNPTYIKYDDYPIPKLRRNVIVNVGRLSKQKNQADLIKAFAIVHKSFKETKLEIYGDGDLRGELESLIDSLDLKGIVTLCGTSNDVIEKIYGAKLFVLSSNYEGMPNALIEAMCVGTPVLSSDCPCGGPRELITDGKNGELFYVGNVEEMSEKIMKMMSRENDDYVLEGKKICNMLDSDKIFCLWLKFIKGIRHD